MVPLHIMNFEIPNFLPFHSFSYCFRDENFFEKSAKVQKFGKIWKIIKFSKYGALSYYHPCDLEIFVSFAVSLSVSEIRFFGEKMANWQNLAKCQSMVLLHIMTLVISNRFRDKNFFLKNGKMAKFCKIIKFSQYGALLV